jgi:hypothetical protein
MPLDPAADGFPRQAPVEKRPPNTASPCNLTDANWKNGVSIIPGRAGITDCDGSTTASLQQGDFLSLPRSGKRRIDAVNRDQVWLEGPPLDPATDGFPRVVRIGLGSSADPLRKIAFSYSKRRSFQRM